MGAVIGVVVVVALLGSWVLWQKNQIAITFSRRYRYQQDRPPDLADFSRAAQPPPQPPEPGPRPGR